MITLDEYAMKRDVLFPEEWAIVKPNAIIFLEKINAFLQELNPPCKVFVSSGFRPKPINEATFGASKNSLHMIGKAIDFQSEDSKFYYFFDPLFNQKHSDLLRKYDLFMEHPNNTKMFTIHRIHGVEHTQLQLWTHIDMGNRVDRPTRVFRPA